MAIIFDADEIHPLSQGISKHPLNNEATGDWNGLARARNHLHLPWTPSAILAIV
jgi:hypothetical protein